MKNPWEKCDNKGLDGSNAEYHKNVAPRIANIRLRKKKRLV